MVYLFPSFTSNLLVSLNLKCVSSGYHIVGSCCLIYNAISAFVGMFGLFIFNVIPFMCPCFVTLQMFLLFLILCVDSVTVISFSLKDFPYYFL